MAAEKEEGFGWYNLIIKFLLFITNIIVWVSGNTHLGGGGWLWQLPG